MGFPQVLRQVAPAAIGGLPLALLLATTASASAFDKLYIFGDSLSDVGNLSQATFGLIPPPPYATGRLSNGPLWVDYLAQDLGLKVDLTNDFAFAGASTDNLNGLSPLFPAPFNQPGVLPGLQQQIDAFVAKPPAPDAEALFILWAGANDYLNPDLTDPTATVTAAVTNLSQDIAKLVSVGAKNILVPNLPSLGQLPLINLDPQRAAGLNLVSGAHNAGLAQSLTGLSSGLPSDVKLIGLDINTLFNQVVANPGQFGLTNVTDACFAASPVLPTPKPGAAPLCDKPDEFLFWDGFHPTTVGHKAISDLALATLKPPTPKPVAEPMSAIAVVGFGLLVGARRQRRA
jgi:phospholipase/lecithinase/hemolysin